ncbi:hypothetical protein LRH25_24735 [Ideonella azotifigens]|uniref:Uncharacterized protein n=1 Tax=Ideonella azotifigens TaxID=513160 RepID=A0ABP3UVR0_9BURK|nr:hypothetical protein [Ideonella azotifigens]MCD2343538.1 hypothetical protein [Ideonella azotifigens]
MQETDTHPALHTLVELHLLNATERQQALAHPELASLPSDLVPAELLRWLIYRKITSEETLSPTRALLAAELTDAQRTLRRQIAADTAEALRQWERQRTQQSLLTLRDLQILSLDQHAKAQAAAEGQPPLASPALALLWISAEALLSPEEIAAVKARVATLPGGPAGDEARAVLAEHDALAGEVNRVMRKAALRQIFPGGPWLWLAGFVLVTGAAAWSIFAPTPVPGCADKNTLASLNSMFFRTTIDARSSNPMAALRGESPGLPQLKNPQEVGFAKAHQIRGCVAQLAIQGEEIPYAYTIARGQPQGANTDDSDKEKTEGFHIVGAEPRIVQARFSHLTSDGDFAQQAAPIGRTALEAAFRDGVATLHRPSSALTATLARQLALKSGGTQLSTLSADRQREIAEIEPLAPCRPEADGQRQRCRLLIERNDELMGMLGMGSGTVLEGEFSFERVRPDAPWTVTEQLAEEFSQALVQGRMDSLRSDASGAPPPPQASQAGVP